MTSSESSDPVAHESTRVACVVVDQAQTSLDPKQVREWMPNASYRAHAFNRKTFDEYLADRDEILPWSKQYAPYALATRDDPPTVLVYGGKQMLPDDRGNALHSAAYGIGLKRRCDELRIPCEPIAAGKRPGQVYTQLSDHLIRPLRTP